MCKNAVCIARFHRQMVNWPLTSWPQNIIECQVLLSPWTLTTFNFINDFGKKCCLYCVKRQSWVQRTSAKFHLTFDPVLIENVPPLVHLEHVIFPVFEFWKWSCKTSLYHFHKKKRYGHTHIHYHDYADLEIILSNHTWAAALITYLDIMK